MEERQGLNDWLQDLADEESDAGHLSEEVDVPEDAELRPELGMYWHAWHALRFDRQYGAMGGESHIPWTAMDRYARRHGITGITFDWFVRLLREMDAEYLPWSADRQKQLMEAEAAKRRTESS